MNKWISIKERTPLYPGRYLTTCKIEDQQLVCILYFDGDTFYEEEVTHWMPLPEPPKED
jgi:hypothetical protein